MPTRMIRGVLPCGFVVLVAVLHPSVAASIIKDIEATGRFHMGDNDTKTDGHRLALANAKRSRIGGRRGEWAELSRRSERGPLQATAKSGPRLSGTTVGSSALRERIA